MNYIVKITEIIQVTHDVKCFRVEKPLGFTFLPGHATDLSMNKPGFEEELRPFTFTALREKPYLEFTIKRYPAHHGVTDRLHEVVVGDEVIICDSWGAIDYRGSGYFIAGGAGITPFIAILRDLYSTNKLAGNRLIFSNKTSVDIIYRDELKMMLGDDAVFILTREKNEACPFGRIDAGFLKNMIPDFTRHFYICGPDHMVAELTRILQESGASAEAVVFEK